MSTSGRRPAGFSVCAVTTVALAAVVCAVVVARPPPPPPPPPPTDVIFLPSGAAHLLYARQWTAPGALLAFVGAEAPITASLYDVTAPPPPLVEPSAAPGPAAECRGPVIHEERLTTVWWPLRRFLQHLQSEAHRNGSARAYVEDTYLYSADPAYPNLARNRGSAGLHRLEPDLPQPLGTAPRFFGRADLARLAGLPCSAIALFIGNGSESSMHQDVGEMNFITQVSGCKHVVTAPPEADAVIGRHPQAPNDALLDTTTLAKWGGIEEQQQRRQQRQRGNMGSSNDEEEEEEEEQQETEEPSLTLCNGAVRVPGARYHRLCAGDALFLPTSTWHALYGDPVPASEPPSMTVTFFFDGAEVL